METSSESSIGMRDADLSFSQSEEPVNEQIIHEANGEANESVQEQVQEEDESIHLA